MKKKSDPGIGPYSGLPDNPFVVPKDKWTRIGMPIELGALANRLTVPIGDEWYTGKARTSSFIDCPACKKRCDDPDRPRKEARIGGRIFLEIVHLQFSEDSPIRLYVYGACWVCEANYVEIA